MPPVESPLLPEVPADGMATLAIRSPAPIHFPLPQTPDPARPHVRGYDILSVIGAGGMGIVYKARQRDLRRTVAIKMLRGAVLADPESNRRFRDEAEAVARLQHPNIIQVFEVGTVEPRGGEFSAAPFISLEFVEGGSLTRLTDRPQPPRQAAGMVEKLARAVHSAHELGVVHRDLKPSNVLLTQEGEPKIADFGVAKLLDAEGEGGGRFATRAGTVVGTPEYMAPEQARGEAPTAAVDIYALGVILYELLTARVPIHAASAVETMLLLRHQEPVPPRQFQPGLARDLETICLKCLEKESGRRYATAAELADDLRRYLGNRPIQARRSTEVEKLTRWCRRNPLVAGSLAGVVGIFFASFALVSWSYWRVEAALSQEAQLRQTSERKEKAERWERYRANIVATTGAFHAYDVGSARLMLEDAPEEHRNWEWRHFHGRLDLARNVLRVEDAKIVDGAIAPDAGRAALFGAGLARVWDTTDGKEVRTFRDIPDFGGTVESQGTTLSPDGKTIAYRPKGHTVALWDIESGRVRATLRGHDRAIFSMAFTADSARLVTASSDQTVRVWDAASGRPLRVFRPSRLGLSHSEISPDGRRLVTSGKGENGRAASLWNLDTGGEIAALTGPGGDFHTNWFDRRSERFVTAERFPNCTLRLWDATTGRLVGVLGRHENAVSAVAFSADGTRIASGSMDQSVRLWDGATCRLVDTLKGHHGRVTCVAFSPDGKRLVSGSEDHTVRLWDATDGRPLAVLNGHTGSLLRLAYSADGSRITSVSADRTIRVWDARMAEGDGILRGHSSFVYSVAFHPDGERVASAGWDGTVRVWNATTGRQTALLDHGAKSIVTSVAIHPAGRLLAARARGFISLWDMDSGRELHRLDAPSDSWKDSRLAFDTKGDLLASGCAGCEVRLWDVHTREEKAVLRGHTDQVRDVAFSPDGQWLATAAEADEKAIRIWDVATRRQVRTLEGHKECVYSLGFSRDGKRLASGSRDGTARLWDTETWRETATLKQGSFVFGVAFTPDDSRLACGCADNSIRLWHVATCQSVAELRGHAKYVHAIAFSPDGVRMASASGDYTVRIWDTIRPQDRRPTAGK